MGADKLLTLIVFVACYFFAISRLVKLSYISLISASILILFGAIPWRVALFEAIRWDVLGIYLGFRMVSFVFADSGVPDYLATKILKHAKEERFVIFTLCAISAFFSSFLENVSVVLMMAPVAIEISRRYNSPLFPYLISIAISSNVVTTVTMIADPPAIIVALESGMKFQDFYWFQGRPSLGTLTVFGVVAALLTILVQFRGMKKRLEIEDEKIEVRLGASFLFIGGVIGLLVGPPLGVNMGVVGLIAGAIALVMGRRKMKEMIRDFDWDSSLFIVGIFVVIGTLEVTGLLKDFSAIVSNQGIDNPSLMLGLLVWVSVGFSSFMDNVPYTILMIPVCMHLASFMGVSPFPFLFGMVVGTGSGGNITPVGAAANVFACGILEKRGYKISLKEYMKIGVPFTVAAVGTIHLLLWLVWM